MNIQVRKYVTMRKIGSGYCQLDASRMKSHGAENDCGIKNVS